MLGFSSIGKSRKDMSLQIQIGFSGPAKTNVKTLEIFPLLTLILKFFYQIYQFLFFF